MKKLAIIFLYLFISNFLYADIITFEIGVKDKVVNKCPSSSITLEVSQNSCTSATYQWQKKSFLGTFTNITGATNSTYLMTSSFISSEAATFRVLVYINKSVLCATSNEISIQYIKPPTISIKYKNQGGQVDNSTLCTTDSVSWVVSKSGGTKPLTTTWSISNGSKAVIIKPVLDTVTIYGILNGNPKIQVSIKDSFGCISSTSAAMFINGASLKSIDTLPSTICEGTIINLKAKLNNTPSGAFPFAFSWVNSSASFTVNANPPPKDSLATLTAISADTAAVLLLKIYDQNTNCVAYYNNKFKIQSAENVDILQSIESSGNFKNDNIVCIGTTFDIDTIAKIGVNGFKKFEMARWKHSIPKIFYSKRYFQTIFYHSNQY
ncbi:MAG: hypothetical protein IPL95_10685 [Saprospiraceae bacterium]|nr:hypothetical protein [Saprospiraceae bacterium]